MSDIRAFTDCPVNVFISASIAESISLGEYIVGLGEATAGQNM